MFNFEFEYRIQLDPTPIDIESIVKPRVDALIIETNPDTTEMDNYRQLIYDYVVATTQYPERPKFGYKTNTSYKFECDKIDAMRKQKYDQLYSQNVSQEWLKEQLSTIQTQYQQEEPPSEHTIITDEHGQNPIYGYDLVSVINNASNSESHTPRDSRWSL